MGSFGKTAVSHWLLALSFGGGAAARSLTVAVLIRAPRSERTRAAPARRAAVALTVPATYRTSGVIARAGAESDQANSELRIENGEPGTENLELRTEEHFRG